MRAVKAFNCEVAVGYRMQLSIYLSINPTGPRMSKHQSVLKVVAVQFRAICQYFGQSLSLPRIAISPSAASVDPSSSNQLSSAQVQWYIEYYKRLLKCLHSSPDRKCSQASAQDTDTDRWPQQSSTTVNNLPYNFTVFIQFTS